MKFNFIKIIRICMMVSICIFINLNFTNAIKISELMYDPIGSKTGHLWVEVYNDEAISVNLTLFKLRESNSNHGIVGISGADFLQSHEYGVIADDDINFKKDYEKRFAKAYIGKLYKASYTLPDKGEKVSLMSKLSSGAFNEVYSIDYTPYVGITSGHSICDVSIEIISNTWHECIDTPGITNQIFENTSIGIVPTTTPTITASSTSTTTNNISSSVNNTVSIPVGINYYVPNTNLYIKVGDLTVQSVRDKNVMAGAEFDMIVRAYDDRGVAIKNLKYYWSMGEGGYFEGESIKYIYHVPGTYDYTIEAGDDRSYAMYRGTIIAHDPKISFAYIATTTNQIVLHNSMNTEIDVGSFLIKDILNNKTFKIARNTFIKANSDLKLNGKAMGFSVTSSDGFTLLATNGLILAQYIKPISTSTQSVTTSTQVSLPAPFSRGEGALIKTIVYKHEFSLKR